MDERYYVGTTDATGTILAVAGPFEKPITASRARVGLVGEAFKYSLPLVIHREPRPVRKVTLKQLQAEVARQARSAGKKRR